MRIRLIPYYIYYVFAVLLLFIGIASNDSDDVRKPEVSDCDPVSGYFGYFISVAVVSIMMGMGFHYWHKRKYRISKIGGALQFFFFALGSICSMDFFRTIRIFFSKCNVPNDPLSVVFEERALMITLAGVLFLLISLIIFFILLFKPKRRVPRSGRFTPQNSH